VRAMRPGAVSFCSVSLRIVNIGSSFSIEKYLDVNYGIINGRGRQ
jgi:hypothetical protein